MIVTNIIHFRIYEENRGERYPVPHLAGMDVKKNKICSVIATNNEKLVPISSPDENKKDTYVFG